MNGWGGALAHILVPPSWFSHR